MTAAAGCWCFVFKKCRGGSVFGAFTGLQLAGYLTVMHFSPHPPVWQLETAFVRLLLHLSGLAVLFVFSTLGPAALPQTQD